MPDKRREIEVDIENAFVRYAKTLGCRAFKLKTPAQRFVPDRVVVGPRALLFFVEFKRPGQKPEAGQERLHNLLRHFGLRVYVCDREGEAERVLDREVAGEAANPF